MKTRPKSTAILPSIYVPLLADLKARVRAAQVKAAVAVNRELILLYWHIGRGILRAQKAEGWGAKVVERLAKDLAAEFPEMGGFSPLNLKRILAFYVAWAPVELAQRPVRQFNGPIVSQPVTQLRKAKGKQSVAQIVSRPVTQLGEPPEPLSLLSWSANLILLHKLKDPATRLWYARKTWENGWSRAGLTVQIKSRRHERSGKAITNFGRTLPPAQSDMAREVLKDPYTFDFLMLGEAAHERDLERGLVQHVQALLLEMGAGLAGKMNFYLSAVDDRMRHADDALRTGLLLCQDAKNKVKVEYALRDVRKPIGVAEWQTRLVESLPKKLRGSLPTIADIERELNKPCRSLAKAKK